ncbi:hypothetical protein DAEQUDRAFT_373586 [Daedalea quercina L-15889]|uniref:Uncharacterized protein n=1 Tax=Daedalea quercina L-15889 TaxID=1314783 RepID=A0A165P6P2_9APHY|nr:hypothetical protein DAEQUDRAFT_373586 [Daedalea quercina L-15889]
MRTMSRDHSKVFCCRTRFYVSGIATGHFNEFLEIWTLWTAILTSILFSRLSLDLREVSAGTQDGGQVLTRTSRSITSLTQDLSCEDMLSTEHDDFLDGMPPVGGHFDAETDTLQSQAPDIGAPSVRREAGYSCGIGGR